MCLDDVIDSWVVCEVNGGVCVYTFGCCFCLESDVLWQALSFEELEMARALVLDM